MRSTLAFYIARRFLTQAGAAFASVLMLVLIVDLIELTRNNSDGTASFLDLLTMAALHAPSITITAAPFTVLLSTMTCFATMARNSELVVARAAGVSVWRLVTPVLVSAVCLGLFVMAVYNPIASAFSARFERLQEEYFTEGSSRLTVSPDGLWLRQGNDASGQVVIRATRASASVDELWEVTFFEFDGSDRPVNRIDAAHARLDAGRWILDEVLFWPLGRLLDGTLGEGAENGGGGLAALEPQTADRFEVATNLTVNRILDSFAPPQTIGFWDLPDFIALLESSGFSSARHRMHWNTLLAVPGVFSAMVLIGAAFSMRHARFGGLGLLALGAVLAGFSYFFLSDISTALGASGVVPVALAAWAPPLSAALAALGLLLHLEDG